MAFLVGAALAIAVAAPQLLSGWGGRLIEEAIEARIDADVEVYDLELHWQRQQRARRVTITTRPDGAGETEKVAEFALRFPSLLQLFESPSTEWEFKVTDAEITARVDADGTSDLGRCLGVDAGDGRSELGVLLGALGRGLDGNQKEDPRSIQTTILVRRARFIDMASGVGSDRNEATVSDLALVATKSRVGYQVKLKDARVEYDVSKEARVSFALNFGGPVGSVHVLRSASVQADAIPLATLRLLGLVPRIPAANSLQRGAQGGIDRRLDSRDSYGSIAGGLLRAAEHFFEGGASVDATYGMLPQADYSGSPEAVPDDDGAKFSLKLEGPVGVLAIAGTHRGEELRADSAQGEDNALEARFQLPPGGLAGLMEGLVPPDSIEFEDTRPDAEWFLHSRSFQIPLAKDEWTAERLFGGGGPTQATRNRGTEESRASGQASVARRMAQLLRRADAEFSVTSRGPSAAALTLWPADTVERRPFDRLDWTHRWTTVTLSGDLGASVRSVWRVEQSARELAELSLSIPAAQLAPGDDLAPRMDLRVPEVSLALLEKLAPLPADLAILLPGRFDRLVLKGLRMPQLLAGSVRSPGQRGGPFTPIVVQALLDGSDWIEGTYEGGTMTIPRASVSVPLDEVYCDKILRAYMPWFARVEPRAVAGNDRSLDIDIRDFNFSMGSEEFEQEGEVELRCGALLVMLHPTIASELSVSERDSSSEDNGSEDGLIVWTPGPIRFSLDGLLVRYDRIELPLSDDYVPTLGGQYDRKVGRYDLSGIMESDFLQGPSGGEALRMVAINGRSAADGGTAAVTFSRGTIDPAFTELMMKAAEIGEKSK